MSEARELLTVRIAGWKNYKEKNTAFSPDTEFYDDAEADDDEDILNYIKRLEAERDRLWEALRDLLEVELQGGKHPQHRMNARENARQALKESEDGS